MTKRMSFDKAVLSFVKLVEKVESGNTARSENDLTSNLCKVLDAIGLSTVIDTGQGKSRKRPDILAYASAAEADLVLDADVVIESKKPEEVIKYGGVSAAIVADEFWLDKTLPYLRSNISKIQFFGLTTFTEFAFFPVTRQLRERIAAIARNRQFLDVATRMVIKSSLVTFHLETASAPNAVGSNAGWANWVKGHLNPSSLRPLPFSEIRNSRNIGNRTELEQFAESLAEFAAGSQDGSMRDNGLFYSVRAGLPNSYESLSPDIKRDLHLFLMTQHPGMDLESVEKIARESPISSIDEFLAASIHSLISRLFAFKAVEDIFCLGESRPLLEQPLWMFGSTAFDQVDALTTRTVAFQKLRDIKGAANPAIRQFATYGAFFDWIEEVLDPVLFSSLLRIYCSHDLSSLEGDLLGRFFEIFAQKVNKTRRKELGQYYTPNAIVRFMWHVAYQHIKARCSLDSLQVLDPAMGSGTFLSEGARVLGKHGVKKFWRKLTGFDIAAQVLGIANVNLYLAVLSQLDRGEADQVGDIQLYATDALDHMNGHYLRLILPLITDPVDQAFIEQRIRISTEAKRHGAYTLVIGNPPYKNNSALTLAQVADRFPRLFSTSKQNARAQERNPRDDYAWFFGAADYYMGKTGLLCFVVSDSFARLSSYRYFRQDLLTHYSVILVVRLGEALFADVGPRISFVVIMLEKRVTAKEPGTLYEAIPYVDMRPGAGIDTDTLGTDEDPRFKWMEKIVSERESIHITSHVPTEESKWSLYPTGPVVVRGTAGKLPIFDKGADRIFVHKWPGIITAFDDLLKGKLRDGLVRKISEFYALASRRDVSERVAFGALGEWSQVNGMQEEDQERLEQIAHQVRVRTLQFDPAKIMKTFSGAMPNDIRWYPPTSYVSYVYYEPILDIPRNKNEGKAVGWGSMQQWREPRSHAISPKFVYTTATKSKYGLKAFVLHDEWCVKLHGGTSQQYHYTGIYNPVTSGRTDGMPNNLADASIRLVQMFREKGQPDEDILFYLGGVYNSEFSAEFMDEAPGRPLGIAVSSTAAAANLMVSIAKAGRMIRDLLWLIELVGDNRTVEATILECHFSEEFLRSIHITKQSQSSKRFRATKTYLIPEGFAAFAHSRRASAQATIDAAVGDLYA
jgi:hypothetical protein